MSTVDPDRHFVSAEPYDEAADLQALIEAEGHDFELAAWDWDFYSDKLRAQRFNFDESVLRPYLELDNVLILNEAFDEKLYLAARNLPNVGICDAASIDPVVLIRFEKVLVTLPALKLIEERLS